MDKMAGPLTRLAMDSSSFCVCYPKAGFGVLMHKHGDWVARCIGYVCPVISSRLMDSLYFLKSSEVNGKVGLFFPFDSWENRSLDGMVAGKQQLCILLPSAPVFLAKVGGGSEPERHPDFRESWFGVSINYITDFPMFMGRTHHQAWFLAIEKRT